jgi:hypothetical protein
MNQQQILEWIIPQIIMEIIIQIVLKEYHLQRVKIKKNKEKLYMNLVSQKNPWISKDQKIK